MIMGDPSWSNKINMHLKRLSGGATKQVPGAEQVEEEQSICLYIYSRDCKCRMFCLHHHRFHYACSAHLQHLGSETIDEIAFLLHLLQ
jgi:hypothetical protein